MEIVGLVVGFFALAVAFYGIYDVRKKVRELLALERNRLYARLVDANAWRFVDPIKEVERDTNVRDIHEFAILLRFLNPSLTLDEAQEYANHESLYLADTFVKRGFAHWRKDFDQARVQIELAKWQSEKNTAILDRIFGEYRTWLARPKKMLTERDD